MLSRTNTWSHVLHVNYSAPDCLSLNHAVRCVQAVPQHVQLPGMPPANERYAIHDQPVVFWSLVIGFAGESLC